MVFRNVTSQYYIRWFFIYSRDFFSGCNAQIKTLSSVLTESFVYEVC